MSELSEISLERKEEWDEVVNRFENATIHYTYGYVKAYSQHEKGEIKLLHFRGTQSEAINVVCKRAIDGTEYFDLTSISGFYGWLVRNEIDEDIDVLSKVIQDYAEKNKIVSEFVRCNPQIKSCSEHRFGQNRLVGKSVIYGIEDEEKIWTMMHAGNRNCIKKAQSYGVTVEVTDKLDHIDDFIRIYDESMSRKEAFDYIMPRSFYEQLFEADGDVLNAYALYEGKIISSAIFLAKNGKAYYHLSASDEEHSNIASMKLVIYEATKYLSKLGYKTIDLGGGIHSREDSVLKFKMKFTKDEPTDFYVLDKVYLKEIYESLCGGKEDDGTFFPLYRKE